MDASCHQVRYIRIEQDEIHSPETSDFFRMKIIIFAEGGRYEVNLYSLDRSKPIPVETGEVTRLAKDSV